MNLIINIQHTLLCTASVNKLQKAPTIQGYITIYSNKIYEYASRNNLPINRNKTKTTLFTPDPVEYVTTLSLKLNNQTQPTTKHPNIFEITLIPKLTFLHYINLAITKSKQTLNILNKPFSPVVLNLFASKYHLEIFLYVTYHKVHQKINSIFFVFLKFFNFRPKNYMFFKKKGLR